MDRNRAERARRYLVVSLYLFAVPALGWLTSLYLESSFEGQFRKAVIGQSLSEAQYDQRGLSYLKLCGRDGALRNSPNSAKICSFADEVQDVRMASATTAILGAAILLLILGARYFAGAERTRLNLVFRPTVRVVMLTLAVALLAQAGLFIFSFYTIEVAAIQRVHGGLLFAIGLAALYGSYLLIRNAFSLLRAKPSPIKAELLAPESNPDLYSLVDEVSKKLGATRPDQIVGGLEPNFFVTSSDVVLIGSKTPPLKGRTLFVSLGLMRIMSTAELAAVVGHELGHFRGEDTEYSLKFAPIYARLSSALIGLTSQKGGSAQFALAPAVATLGTLLTEFAEAERTISRKRELLADRAGAEATSPELLASALVKVSLYSETWNWLTRKHIEVLAEGKCYQNLAELYESVCNSMVSSLDWVEARHAFSQFVQPHPIDTHPPLGQRLEALGVSVGSLDASVGKPATDRAVSLISKPEDIERRLTTLEIEWLRAIGAVVLPRTSQ